MPGSGLGCGMLVPSTLSTFVVSLAWWMLFRLLLGKKDFGLQICRQGSSLGINCLSIWEDPSLRHQPQTIHCLQRCGS